jgi:hypothetical protein
LMIEVAICCCTFPAWAARMLETMLIISIRDIPDPRAT